MIAESPDVTFARTNRMMVIGMFDMIGVILENTIIRSATFSRIVILGLIPG